MAALLSCAGHVGRGPGACAALGCDGSSGEGECCAGEIMMQLLTLNTQPIDDGMRKSIVDFADAGKHIVPSTALSWPKTTAETFEAVAIACMRAGDGEDTAKALNDGVVPALQSMRGETLQTMWKQSGAGAKQRADGSYIVPTAYRCVLFVAAHGLWQQEQGRHSSSET